MERQRGRQMTLHLCVGALTLLPPPSVLRRTAPTHRLVFENAHYKVSVLKKKNKITTKAHLGIHVVCLVDPGLICTPQTLEESFVRNKCGECVLLPWS